jgi:glycosyltransferase involved in cell wall biosynthesis
MARLVYVCTIPSFAQLLLSGQLRDMRRRGFDVTLVSSPGPELDVVERSEGVRTVPVPMEREISPLRDLVSLIRMVRAFRRLKPDIVNAGNPKAGLLGMLAARLAAVPVRVYTLHGLRLETTSGVKYGLLACTEWLSAKSAQRVLCVSESVRSEFERRRLGPREKLTVTSGGSANGVDTERFRPRNRDRERHAALRRSLGIPADAPVIGFVGRFTRDKGISELFAAFEALLLAQPEAWLLLVGDFEPGDPVTADDAARMRAHPQVVLPGFIPDPAPYYQAMDILALPSHREGFGTVVLEAAASAIPTVAYRVTGIVDSIEHGVTGTLVDEGDVAQLAVALGRYLGNAKLRRQHGAAAAERAATRFRQSVIWDGIHSLYRSLLGESTQAHDSPA